MEFDQHCATRSLAPLHQCSRAADATLATSASAASALNLLLVHDMLIVYRTCGENVLQCPTPTSMLSSSKMPASNTIPSHASATTTSATTSCEKTGQFKYKDKMCNKLASFCTFVMSLKTFFSEQQQAAVPTSERRPRVTLVILFDCVEEHDIARFQDVLRRANVLEHVFQIVMLRLTHADNSMTFRHALFACTPKGAIELSLKAFVPSVLPSALPSAMCAAEGEKSTQKQTEVQHGAPLASDATTIVIQQEDDYVHQRTALSAWMEGLHVASYASAYTHPDKVASASASTMPLPIRAGGGELGTLYLTPRTYWHTTQSTTMTFATTLEKLRADMRHFEAVATPGREPADAALWPLLRAANGRILVAPVVALSTHAEYAHLSPLVDWKAVVDAATTELL